MTYPSLFVVDHYVVGFHISVHYAFTVTVVERLHFCVSRLSHIWARIRLAHLQQFENVVSNIVVDEFGV